jgi:uncharacterized protein (DUF305 family)
MKTMKRLILAGAVLALGISATAVAQSPHGGMPSAHEPMMAMMHQGMQGGDGHGPMHGDGMPGKVEGDQSPASLALRGANEKMHRDMAITLTGDADVDFVRSMIPHHQGAIDMAKIVIAFGEDPEIRQLAESIIAAQEKEIAEMRAWLARKGK